MDKPNEFANHRSIQLLVVIAFLFAVSFLLYQSSHGPQRVEASPLSHLAPGDNPQKARAAFSEAVKVFFSARCVNCHPAADSPLQGNDSKAHEPEVTRGSMGRGTEDIQCTLCHLETNTDGANMPPGVPDWHMPTMAQKMVFQGLTAAQLCNNLKDPLKNGGRRSAKDAVEHLATDPKVLWAWNPGSGRTTPPISHGAFLKKMNEWVANGAACPK